MKNPLGIYPLAHLHPRYFPTAYRHSVLATTHLTVNHGKPTTTIGTNSAARCRFHWHFGFRRSHFVTPGRLQPRFQSNGLLERERVYSVFDFSDNSVVLFRSTIRIQRNGRKDCERRILPSTATKTQRNRRNRVARQTTTKTERKLFEAWSPNGKMTSLNYILKTFALWSLLIPFVPVASKIPAV